MKSRQQKKISDSDRPPIAEDDVTKVSFDPPDHPSALTLASLANGELPNDEREKHAGHLAGCRRCMAIYAEFVEHVLGESNAQPPRDWIDPAMRVPETAPKGVALGPRKRTLKWAWAAILVPVVVLTLVLFNRPQSARTIPDALQTDLAAALRADSQGSLVYGDALPPEPRGIRGGNSDGSLTPSSLDRLLDIYRARPADSEAAYWVVSGYLATNQLRNADPFLRDALKSDPGDPRFLNLAAILAYKQNRLDDAETNLRRAAEMDRTATVLVNLAVVRRQQGDENEAQALLSEVLSRFPDSPLSPYVRELAASTH